MKFVPLVVLVLLAAACAPRGPERTSEQNPTVSYSYDDMDEVKQTAAKYCHDNYGRSARVVDDVKSGDQRVMTFECVITP